jgi:hypothetical protein
VFALIFGVKSVEWMIEGSLGWGEMLVGFVGAALIFIAIYFVIIGLVAVPFLLTSVPMAFAQRALLLLIFK